jgi:hypothetical protein
MSERNGDRARYQKDLKRKRRRRQRMQVLSRAVTPSRGQHARVEPDPADGNGRVD